MDGFAAFNSPDDGDVLNRPTSSEMVARLEERLKEASPAAVRGQATLVASMWRRVLLYGLIGMSMELDTHPSILWDFINTEETIQRIASERNIDLEAPLTEEEAVEHREFFASVFQDIIAFAERQKARAGQKPMLPMSGVWEEGKLDA